MNIREPSDYSNIGSISPTIRYTHYILHMLRSSHFLTCCFTSPKLLRTQALFGLLCHRMIWQHWLWFAEQNGCGKKKTCLSWGRNPRRLKTKKLFVFRDQDIMSVWGTINTEESDLVNEQQLRQLTQVKAWSKWPDMKTEETMRENREQELTFFLSRTTSDNLLLIF